MQNVEHIELDRITVVFAACRAAAEQHVQPFAGDAVAQFLVSLGLPEMRQQICDDKHRVIGVLTDCYLDSAAVLAHDDSVQRQRHCHPLVLLDAAVVMRVEQRHTALLVQRSWLEVEAR